MIRVESTSLRFLPGTVKDYMDGPVVIPAHIELAAEAETQAAARADAWPIPEPAAREGYYGDHHYEYWLSGRRTMQIVCDHVPPRSCEQACALDFGGASGRVFRHFAQTYPRGNWFLCDINIDHVLLVNHAFPGLKAFANFHLPSLPFDSGSLDFITAFSVFTHIDEQEVQWLLELRRCLRRGGALIVSLHNDDTWRILKTAFVWQALSRDPEFVKYHEEHGTLTERVAAYYSDAAAYNCNMFHSDAYLRRVWARHFQSLDIFPLKLEYQSLVVMIK